MSDLISRQAALDVLRNLAFDYIFQYGEYYGEDERQLTIINAEKAIDVIEALPSTEPERKKGKWIPDKSGIVYWNCSECGFASEAFGADILYHFCPNCGARMEIRNNE